MVSRNKVFGISIETRHRRRTLVVFGYLFLSIVACALWPYRATSAAILTWIWYAAFAVNAIAFGGYSGFPWHFGMVKPFQNRHPREVDIQSELIELRLEQLTHLPFAERRDAEFWRNDEREISRRDAVHYRAYQPLTVILTIICVLANWSLHRPSWLSETVLSGLLSAVSNIGVILALTLPQAIILWTEPDLAELDSKAAIAR